jgi:hypothetical protein
VTYSDDTKLFARYVQLLPDPGGDGVPDLAVLATGDKGNGNQFGAYVFDGTLQGIVASADADARIELGTRSTPMLGIGGDVDEDGHIDLVAGDLYVRPLEGALTLSDAYYRGWPSRTQGQSVDGDEHVDVVAPFPDWVGGASGTSEWGLGIIFGPIPPGTFADEDFDLWFQHDCTRYQFANVDLTAADVDGDGSAEIVAGCDRYMMHDSMYGYQSTGFIAAFDVHAWSY